MQLRQGDDEPIRDGPAMGDDRDPVADGRVTPWRPGSTPARTGIGLHIDERGAVMAVVRTDAWRLAGIATVTWPDDPAAARWPAGRVLTRARRRLGVPRWSAVAVVLGAFTETGLRGPNAGTGVDVPLWTAGLLARAGLVQGWLADDRSAEGWRRSVDLAVQSPLAAAAAAPAAGLAIGAALGSAGHLTTHTADVPRLVGGGHPVVLR